MMKVFNAAANVAAISAIPIAWKVRVYLAMIRNSL
jgi:hypothetical protein